MKRLILYPIPIFIFLMTLPGCAVDRSMCKERQPNPATKEGMAAELQEQTEDLKRQIYPNSVPPRKYFCAGYTIQE